MNQPTHRIEYVFEISKLMEAVHKIAGGDSLRDIETRTGISASTLSRMDNGKVPDMDTFLSLCSAFELTPGDYFKRYTWQLVEALA